MFKKQLYIKPLYLQIPTSRHTLAARKEVSKRDSTTTEQISKKKATDQTQLWLLMSGIVRIETLRPPSNGKS